MNAWLEENICRAPAQYLWLYKRFSRQPDGQNPYKAGTRQHDPDRG